MEQIISEITAVSSKGQIVLPKKIRDQLKIKAGTKLIVISDNKNIILKPIMTPDISEFKVLVDTAADFARKAGVLGEDAVESIPVVRKPIKLGAAKGKFNCPLTLEDFDKDNEEIAGMLTKGEL